MARYMLLCRENRSEEWWEVGGQRKSTKKQVEQWIQDNIKPCGLDWRVGYMVKFLSTPHLYEWVWIKNGKPIKP